MAALSTEILSPGTFHVEQSGDAQALPAPHRFAGKPARQKAIETIEAFGTPKNMYIGVNKDTISRVSVRREAHWRCEHQKYISLNLDFAEHRKRRVIVIDIDDRWQDDAWLKITDLIREGEIPKPAFASFRWATKKNESRRVRAHFVFPLQFAVNEGDVRQKFFMNAVLEHFYDVLESHGIPVDRNQGVTFKNPASREWDVFHFADNRHSLRDWAELFGISDLEKSEQKAINIARRNRKRARRAARKASITGERNLDVFEMARHKCYAAKFRCASHEQFHGIVSDIVRETHAALGYAVGLSAKELAQIAKSISRWTWEKYEGSGYCERDRGACAGLLVDGMDLEDRQRVGAAYSHDKRAQKVIRKIKDSYDTLLAEGKKISVRVLAAAAGVSATTAQKYRKIVEEGVKLASKAGAVSREIKERIAAIVCPTDDTASPIELCHDGVSEYPPVDLPQGPTKRLTLRKRRTSYPQHRNIVGDWPRYRPNHYPSGQVQPRIDRARRPRRVNPEDQPGLAPAHILAAAGLVTDGETPPADSAILIPSRQNYTRPSKGNHAWNKLTKTHTS
ncbi:hypothetical protein [Ruegeria atlantica]|uniref:hypothetical protein n=1 Tax=Ruegeria atlantica TaxID=81569 RepID=UPI0014819480|nr:hypothetical protein [Ruegeria atlantica]